MAHHARPGNRPATFREVFASIEFRAVFGAAVLSWVGDFMAKAAVSALVYRQTGSVATSAATFAVGFLPWVVGGPVLAALAERYPPRTVMITCDVLRALLIALLALPRVPVAAMLAILFTAALLNPPFEASRSALLPRILDGDRYVVGLATQNSTGQGAQVIGYLCGAALGAINPRLALLLDATTFLISGVLIALWVRSRPALLGHAQRTHLLKETAQGFRVVFGTPVLRAIALTVLAVQLFSSPVEGLAAAWAARLDPAHRGLAQGLIMMGTPFGYFVGGLVLTRLIRPDQRRTLIRPFAVLAPAMLVPVVLNPSATVVAGLAALCGLCTAGMLPASNGLFVQALPRMYRARAFGVMQSGMQITLAVAVMTTALLSNHAALPTVVGLWGLAGIVLVIAVSIGWPSAAEFTAAIDRTNRANAAAEEDERRLAGTAPVPPRDEAVVTAPIPEPGGIPETIPNPDGRAPSSNGRHRRGATPLGGNAAGEAPRAAGTMEW